MTATRTGVFEEHSRGRYKSRLNLYGAPLKSIILISKKYELDPKLLVNALAKAWKDKTSVTEADLTIRCRDIDRDSVTFLITKGEKVVSQFPMKAEVLRDPEFFERLIQSIPEPEFEPTKVIQRQKKIGELRFGMEGVNVKGKVVDVPPRKLVVTSFGNQIYVSNIRIADETGTIKLSLWNGQIDQVHVGDEVEITNCHVASFGGEPQLRINRKGSLAIASAQNGQ